jgi:hypothetical protein
MRQPLPLIERLILDYAEQTAGVVDALSREVRLAQILVPAHE